MMSGAPVKVIHVVHHPVGAKAFIDPVVAHLRSQGFDAELWLEDYPGLEKFYAAMLSPTRLVPCDLLKHYKRPLAALGNLRRALRTSGTRVLHVHQTRASVLPLLAARLECVPVRVYHNHGLSYPAFAGPKRWLIRLYQRLLIGLSTHVVFVSHSNMQRGEADGLLGRKRGQVLGEGSIAGIDLEEYPPDRFAGEASFLARQKWGIRPDAFVIGYVGRPTQSKGFPQMLRAWQVSKVQTQGGKLLIAGCSSDEIQALGYRHGPDVICLGYIEDMKSYYAACDAVALPSRSEGFPYSLLEAAAAARPALGTRVPGVVDAIEDGITGFLVPLDDATALATAIDRLASDSALCQTLGANARKRVESKFSRKEVLACLLNFYRTKILHEASIKYAA